MVRSASAHGLAITAALGGDVGVDMSATRVGEVLNGLAEMDGQSCSHWRALDA
jgi:hypothetical protein